MKALLILTAETSAVFSERAATEGDHRTLAYPTGAALLGWAARCYEAFKTPIDERHRIFHGGGVWFSNALPLNDAGCIAYPMPQLIAEPKHARGGIIKDPADTSVEVLAPPALRVGRKPKVEGEEDVQFEPLRKSLLVTAGGEVFDPGLGSRLRTATKEGRAAEGQLFGYRHMSGDGAPRYVATIEAAAGLSVAAWDRLLACFDGTTLRLGRAANTGYGGSYACRVVRDRTDDVWPIGQVAAGARRVRVWALSDLALVDADGAACFAPSAAMLGLPVGGRLDGADSAIGVRRYAPWNSHLCSRDTERQMISAGSVISFRYDDDPGAPASDGPGVVGLYREAGLGRVWVAPRLLEGDPGEPPKLDPEARRPLTAVGPRRVVQVAVDKPADPLLDWLGARR